MSGGFTMTPTIVDNDARNTNGGGCSLRITFEPGHSDDYDRRKECYDVVPSQVCVRCNAFQVEEEHAELVRNAFRRGAEAMREACAKVLDDEKQEWGNGGNAAALCWKLATYIRALPIPEEP